MFKSTSIHVKSVLILAATGLAACSSGEGTIEPTATPSAAGPTATEAPTATATATETLPSPTEAGTPGPTPTERPEITPTRAGFLTADRFAVVSTSDYSNGQLTVIDPGDWQVVKDQQAVTGDTVVHGAGRMVFAFNRAFFSGGKDTIDVYFADNLYKWASVPISDSDNPNDLVVVGDKGYISLNGGAGILVIDMDSYEVITTIDLSAYGDTDGRAEPATMIVHDGKIFAGLQRFDYNTFTPASPGYVAEINPNDDTVTRTLELTGTNATSLYAEGSTLWVVSGGAYNDGTGGIETVDLSTGTSGGFLITEATLGVDVFSMTFTGGVGYVAIGGALTAIDLSDGTTSAGPTALDGLSVAGAWSDVDGNLWVSDGAAITVVDPVGDSVISGGALNTGTYGPYSLTFAEYE